MLEQKVMTVKSGNAWHTVCPFPVGYIYLSYTNTSPAGIFGGSWTALTNGALLRPAGAWNTGGSSKIATTNLPSHRHDCFGSGKTYWSIAGWSGDSPIHFLSTSYVSGTSWQNTYLYTSNTGGGADYWPYYQNCFAWYRTK